MPHKYTITPEEQERRRGLILNINKNMSDEQRRDKAVRAATTRESRRKADQKRLQELEAKLSELENNARA